MTNEELKLVLEKHKQWIACEPDGKRADLQYADLQYADLHNADLRGADLQYANLQHAKLTGADLRGADLRGAELRGATLHGATLAGADLDYSSWPLWCGSLNVKIDKRIACQLLYHALRAMQSVDDPEVLDVCALPQVVALANQFHRVDECGKIEPKEEKDK